MTISSIKHKTLLILCGFTTGLSVIYFALVIFISYAVEDEIIERLLRIETTRIQEQYRITHQLVVPQADYINLYEDFDALPEVIQAELRQSPQTEEVFTPTQDHYHLVTIKLYDQKSVFLVAEVSPLLVVTYLSSRVLLLFSIAFFATLLLGVWIGYKLSLITATPIVELAESVKKQLAQKNELSLKAYPYEIGYLSQTLEHSINQLQHALTREQNFTRDVSHELRTPLTIIKNTLILSDSRELTNKDTQDLKSACEQIEVTLNALLSLARAESLTKSDIALNELIEETIIECSDELIAGSFEVDIDIPSNIQVTANRHLLKLVITNIINNAINHASSPSLKIRYQDKQLAFHNTIENIEHQDITQAGVKNKKSKGMGQGLFLVSRMVESMSWTFNITQTKKEFTLTLNLADKKATSYE
ncbi:HAMP domain-containing sensor histidine kinase [Pleionea sp. CnH1-48]|uniref:sensor histidine kinase n=1 Tax=Pleionea sp. CnH1-48 TaxID=2954494 RepID=UPI002096F76B|nr:HAMP domain-containing sensor histidine kinase [Pleionea sp. CnH1-48]MCO7226704.1 HAMP domain-containing histidine kinase [Pleionea sp. CnH1-48]